MSPTDEGGRSGSKEGVSGLPRQLRVNCRLRGGGTLLDLSRANNFLLPVKEFLIVNIYVLGVMVRWAGLVERVGQGMVCWTPETPNIISQSHVFGSWLPPCGRQRVSSATAFLFTQTILL